MKKKWQRCSCTWGVTCITFVPAAHGQPLQPWTAGEIDPNSCFLPFLLLPHFLFAYNTGLHTSLSFSYPLSYSSIFLPPFSPLPLPFSGPLSYRFSYPSLFLLLSYLFLSDTSFSSLFHTPFLPVPFLTRCLDLPYPSHFLPSFLILTTYCVTPFLTAFLIPFLTLDFSYIFWPPCLPLAWRRLFLASFSCHFILPLSYSLSYPFLTTFLTFFSLLPLPPFAPCSYPFLSLFLLFFLILPFLTSFVITFLPLFSIHPLSYPFS